MNSKLIEMDIMYSFHNHPIVNNRPFIMWLVRNTINHEFSIIYFVIHHANKTSYITFLSMSLIPFLKLTSCERWKTLHVTINQTIDIGQEIRTVTFHYLFFCPSTYLSLPLSVSVRSKERGNFIRKVKLITSNRQAFITINQVSSIVIS